MVRKIKGYFFASRMRKIRGYFFASNVFLVGNIRTWSRWRKRGNWCGWRPSCNRLAPLDGPASLGGGFAAALSTAGFARKLHGDAVGIRSTGGASGRGGKLAVRTSERARPGLQALL